MRFYTESQLYEQVSFIGYYFHWQFDEILNLDHLTRERFCKEISKINKKANGAGKNIFDI